MNASHFFDSVVVIESRQSNERPTGKNLFDQVIEPVSKVHQGIATKYHEVQSSQELFGVLEELLSWCKKESRSPVLHIEAHGTLSGLTMANGECVSWEKLRPALTEINVATGLNLLVVLGVCNGIGLVQIMHPTQRSPAWGIVGPREEVGDLTIESMFMEFYQLLLSLLDGRRALDALNAGKGIRDWTFQFIPAEVMYMKVFVAYQKEFGSPQALKERESHILKVLKERGMPQQAQDSILNDLRGRLKDDESWFEKLQKKFFLHDLFPNNAERFKLNFHDLDKYRNP